MKIQESLNRIYQSGTVQQTPKSPSVRETRPQAPEPRTRGHKNIPRDYQPKVGLTKKEQAFFAKLFPAQQRQLETYMQQQNKSIPEKGKIIDMKG